MQVRTLEQSVLTLFSQQETNNLFRQPTRKAGPHVPKAKASPLDSLPTDKGQRRKVGVSKQKGTSATQAPKKFKSTVQSQNAQRRVFSSVQLDAKQSNNFLQKSKPVNDAVPVNTKVTDQIATVVEQTVCFILKCERNFYWLYYTK